MSAVCLLLPELTVFDNIALALRMSRLAPRGVKERVERYAELLGVSQFLRRMPAELSMGQRRLVGIVRTLSRELPVLVLDEPTCNLDEAQRARVISTLLDQKGTCSRTVLFTTHYMPDVSAVDNVIVLQDGKVGYHLRLASDREQNLHDILHCFSQVLAHS